MTRETAGEDAGFAEPEAHSLFETVKPQRSHHLWPCGNYAAELAVPSVPAKEKQKPNLKH